jgi:hypothetical protein
MTKTTIEKYESGQLVQRTIVEVDSYESTVKCGDMSRTRHFNTFEEIMQFSGFDNTEKKKEISDIESKH